MKNKKTEIPLVSEEAMKEAYGQMLKLSMITDEKLCEKKLIKYKKLFYTRQPNIAEFVQTLCNVHYSECNGKMGLAQFVMYSMAIVNAVHIQKEIDSIKNIFDIEGEDNE